MFAATLQTAQATSMPDVCKTPAPPGPPVPIPYVNTAQTSLANPFSTKVLICSSPALHKSSKISISMGDTSGVAGGVVSGSFMGECEFTTASTKVKFEGKPAVRQLDSVKSNKGNTFGALLQPSQVKVDLG